MTGSVGRNDQRAPARLLGAAALLAAALVGTAAGTAAAEEFDPEAAVDALNGVFGAHKGARAAHAKGLCATGAFTPTDEARAFSSTELFAPGDRPVVFRFSTGSGVPTATDKEASVRGMAARFALPSGGEMDMVIITVPVFLVREPADLVTLLRLNAPDPATGKPDKAKVEAFVAAHPEVKQQGELVAKQGIPASYASTPYYGVHTFLFAPPAGGSGEPRPARWTFTPEGGTKSLTEAEVKDGPDEFLGDELRARAAQGRAAWEVSLQLPEAGDPLLDPTVAWPEGRRRTVKVGRLAVTGVQAAGERGDCHETMYNPLALADGIQPSDDPVLAARPAAYAVSLSRRQQ